MERRRKFDLQLVVLLILGVLGSYGFRVESSGSEAYVTLLYGDEFLLGVRVLGKSIRDTGSTKDMVVLATDGVSHFANTLLQADGWIVQPISLLVNPNNKRPKRFWGVYTKLKIFNMVQYKKVVYLDADTVVLRNIDELFRCGKFCANLKHSERLNSGVMVVEPSEIVFQDMMSKVNILPSYTGGDQGFLNSYYTGFANAPVFYPNSTVMEMNPRPEMVRLSTIYNADVGLYLLANKWMVDEKELRIIHYTLGPLKPWDWWTAWFLDPVDIWQRVHMKLDESLPGTGGGKYLQQLFLTFLHLFPLLIFILSLCFSQSYFQTLKGMGGYLQTCFLFNSQCLCFRKRRGGGYSIGGVSSSSVVTSNLQLLSSGENVPLFLGAISIFICFSAFFLALALSLFIIPRQIKPWTGLVLLYEWVFMLFFIIFGSYVHFVYEFGKESNSGVVAGRADTSPSFIKGNQRQQSSCDAAGLFYWGGMTFLAVMAPTLPSFLGISALFLRLGLLIGGCLLLVSFMTYAAEHLAISAYRRGRDHHHPF